MCSTDTHHIHIHQSDIITLHHNETTTSCNMLVTVISSYTLSPQCESMCHIDSQCEVGCQNAVTVNTGSLSCATVLPTKASSRAKQDSKSRSSNELMLFYGIESVLAEIRNELGSLTRSRDLITANVVKTPQSVVLIRLDSGLPANATTLT